ncbi:YcxB family protein [Verrucomicrobiaceae bacterium 227]
MIEGKYLFTVDEMLKASDHAASQKARPSLRRLIVPLGIGLMVVGILLWKKPISFVSIYLVTLGTYLTFLRKLVARHFVRKNFAKRPDQNVEVKFTADHEEISFSTANSNSSCQWALFSKVLKLQDGVLLYSNDQIYHWIPAHAFASRDDFKAFTGILRKNVINFREDPAKA